MRTVVLDPGHGGHDKGALSNFGTEKELTLDLARQLKPLLEAKGPAGGDDARQRCFCSAGSAGADRQHHARIFVRIHFNAADANPAAAGFESYSLTPRGAPSTQDNTLAMHFLICKPAVPLTPPVSNYPPALITPSSATSRRAIADQARTVCRLALDQYSRRPRGRRLPDRTRREPLPGAKNQP